MQQIVTPAEPKQRKLDTFIAALRRQTIRQLLHTTPITLREKKQISTADRMDIPALLSLILLE